VWELYARVHVANGDLSKALDSKFKMCRALQKSGWQRDQAMFVAVASGCCALVDAAIRYANQEPKPSDGVRRVHSALLTVRGAAKKTEATFGNLEEHKKLAAAVQRLIDEETRLKGE